MKVQLKDIADIQTGVFRKPDIQGEIIYLQAKHFTSEGRLKATTLLTGDLKNDEKLKNHLLRDKDILFAAKGPRNFACLYEAAIGQATASSTFLVIRLKDETKKKVLAEYLLWFMNHPVTLAFLKDKAMGSAIPSVAKTTLGDLEISIPDLDIQARILEINQLFHKEKELTATLLQKKQEMYNAILYRLANKE